jgi:hypothetical protein
MRALRVAFAAVRFEFRLIHCCTLHWFIRKVLRTRVNEQQTSPQKCARPDRCFAWFGESADVHDIMNAQHGAAMPLLCVQAALSSTQAFKRHSQIPQPRLPRKAPPPAAA